MCCSIEKGAGLNKIKYFGLLSYNTEALNLKQIDPKAWVAARIKFWKM
jgi:hypothetical protein